MHIGQGLLNVTFLSILPRLDLDVLVNNSGATWGKGSFNWNGIEGPPVFTFRMYRCTYRRVSG